MLGWIRQNFIAFLLALVLHSGIIALLVLSMNEGPKPRIPDTGKKVRIVQAQAVKEADIQSEMQRIRREERRRRNRERARQRRLDQQARRAREARRREQRRLQALKRRQADEQRRLRAQRKKAAERQAALRRKRRAEERRLAKIRQQRLRAERDRKAAAKRLADLKAKRAAEERRAREAEARRRREAEMRRAMEAEEKARQAARNKQLLSLRQKYIALIHNAVKSRWRRPPSVKKGDTCTVLVQQIPGGEVVSVNVTKCTGNAVAFQRSVRTAVLKASPLPPPPDPAVFDRDIRFRFNPDNK